MAVLGWHLIRYPQILWISLWMKLPGRSFLPGKTNIICPGEILATG
jgi:hypothetical protein